MGKKSELQMAIDKVEADIKQKQDVLAALLAVRKQQPKPAPKRKAVPPQEV